jgi:hypothetical protein
MKISLLSRTLIPFAREGVKPAFVFRRYKPLHDRFVIVDNTGYVLGPSIKDAASNSPALIVELDNEKRFVAVFLRRIMEEGQDSFVNPIVGLPWLTFTVTNCQNTRVPKVVHKNWFYYKWFSFNECR